VTGHALEVERIVSDYRDAWGEPAYADLRALVSESFAMYDPVAPGGVVHGPDGLEAFVRELTTGFPDLQSAMIDALSGDGLLLCETEVTGTHEREFAGVAPTGRRFEIRAMEKFRVAGGVLEEHRVCFDARAFRDQLGFTD